VLLGNHIKKSTKEILDVFLFVKLESPIDKLGIDGDSDCAALPRGLRIYANDEMAAQTLVQ